MKKKNIKNITMYSTNWCADCFRSKHYFDRNELEFDEINIDKDPDSADLVMEINNGNRSVPTIVFTFENGQTHILVEPTSSDLDNMVYENKN